MTRQAAELRGRRAEAVAAWWLRLKGYRILARRVRTALGEIDLVARRGRTLAFVEVKTRPDMTSAALAIDSRSQRRISRAANLLLTRFDVDVDSARIDVVLVVPWKRPRHIVGAWPGE